MLRNNMLSVQPCHISRHPMLYMVFFGHSKKASTLVNRWACTLWRCEHFFKFASVFSYLRIIFEFIYFLGPKHFFFSIFLFFFSFWLIDFLLLELYYSFWNLCKKNQYFMKCSFSKKIINSKNVHDFQKKTFF